MTPLKLLLLALHPSSWTLTCSYRSDRLCQGDFCRKSHSMAQSEDPRSSCVFMNLFVSTKVFNLLDQLTQSHFKQSVSGSDSLETRIPRSRGTSLRSVNMLYFNEVYASLVPAVINRTSRIFRFLFVLSRIINLQFCIRFCFCSVHTNSVRPAIYRISVDPYWLHCFTPGCVS